VQKCFSSVAGAVAGTAGNGRTVLISGASIAGPALAFWLSKYGFRPTIVERAPELRQGGQNIDMEGAAVSVTQLMDGLDDDIRAASTGEVRRQHLLAYWSCKAEHDRNALYSLNTRWY
jgi:2-polyprenyl-6-methoxyphenol hydroxylase-like FAD-dependent oxidoreductase